MLIGLVGLSGSGKSYISRLLCSYNEHIIHLDIDKIAHEALQDELTKKRLIEVFGPSILEGNIISRPKLASIVFNSEKAMDYLNKVVWQYEERRIDTFIDEHPNNIIILDWLLLPKTKYFANCDFRVLITAPQEVRMERAMARDNITAEKFLERDASAPELNPNLFEYIINNIELEKTKKKVDEIYDKSIIHR